MEQFIGCDAHKKFSVFVAVNERGHAGEALRVSHDRQRSSRTSPGSMRFSRYSCSSRLSLAISVLVSGS
jgi:hypothetical protein